MRVYGIIETESGERVKAAYVDINLDPEDLTQDEIKRIYKEKLPTVYKYIVELEIHMTIETKVSTIAI